MSDQPAPLPALFQCSRHLAGYGFTWTLASRLADMLARAEALYGPRDPAWTFTGVEFHDGRPQTWFPGDGKYVVIQLGFNALADHVLACYQLAHECIHLLSPLKNLAAPRIEEGLAVVFSDDYVQRMFNRVQMTRDANYLSSAALVRELLAIAPTAIAKLRAVQMGFNDMTSETFDFAGLSHVPLDLRAMLLAPFQYKE